LIAFVGSAFSPYYALARRLGQGDPLNHCALNIALYGAQKRWALTERTRADLVRDDTSLAIGPSRLDWNGTSLAIEIDEITVPLPTRIKGAVRVLPNATVGRAFSLDAQGRHRWQPIAPCARVEVEMQKPALRWSGAGYLDCNFGDEPLEAAFAGWNWGRAPVEGGTAVLYDVERRDGIALGLALRFSADGSIESFEPPSRFALPGTLWRVERQARSENSAPVLIKTLEDTPFYARSLIGATLLGERTIGVHESLSLDRVAHPIVRAMLPFRMPRKRARAR
jgi:carotenoid 1,2-hydratase